MRGVDGYSDFNALHSGKHNDEVELIAFDVLAMDGDDLRDLPLSMRKTNLQRLLANVGRTASSCPTMSGARTDQSYSEKLASLVWRALSPSGPIGLIRVDGPPIG